MRRMKTSSRLGSASSHLMPGSDPAELKGAAEKRFRGPVVVGEDLLEV